MEWKHGECIIKIDNDGKFKVVGSNNEDGQNYLNLKSTSLESLKRKINNIKLQKDSFIVWKGSEIRDKNYYISKFSFYKKGVAYPSYIKNYLNRYIVIDEDHPKFNEIKKQYEQYKEEYKIAITKISDIKSKLENSFTVKL